MISRTKKVGLNARLAARAFRTRVKVAVLLRTVPMDEVLTRLTPDSPRELDESRYEHTIELTARASRRVLATRWPKCTCLTRALTRYTLLRELGVPATFVMGVRPENEDVVGHAWLEVGDEVVLESEPPDYNVTFRHPNAPVT